MEIKASAKYLRISPRKLRSLTVDWAGKPVEAVLRKLASQPQRGQEFLEKVVKQAIANAKNNFKITGNLRIKTVEVGDGTATKRMDKSHGARFDRGIIKKRTAHLFLTILGEEEKNKEIPELKSKVSKSKPEEKKK